MKLMKEKMQRVEENVRRAARTETVRTVLGVAAVLAMFAMLFGHSLPDVPGINLIAPLVGTVMYFWGGWPFRLVWILVAGLVAYEWLAIIGRGNAIPAGIGVIVAGLALTYSPASPAALAGTAAAAALLGALATPFVRSRLALELCGVASKRHPLPSFSRRNESRPMAKPSLELSMLPSAAWMACAGLSPASNGAVILTPQKSPSV